MDRRQNRAIHGLLSQKGLDLDQGREIAASINSGIRSLSALSVDQADELIERLGGEKNPPRRVAPPLRGGDRHGVRLRSVRVWKEAGDDLRAAVLEAGKFWDGATRWANWAHSAGYEEEEIEATLKAMVRLTPTGNWWSYGKKVVALLRVRRLEKEHEERKKAPVVSISQFFGSSKIKDL